MVSVPGMATMRAIHPSSGGVPAIPGAVSGPGGVPQVAMNRHNLTYLLYGAVIFAVLGLLPMISARCRRDDDTRGGKSRRKMRRQAQRVATEEDDIEDAIMDGADDVPAAMDDEEEEEQLARPREKKKKKKDKGRARV